MSVLSVPAVGTSISLTLLLGVADSDKALPDLSDLSSLDLEGKLNIAMEAQCTIHILNIGKT